MQSTVAFRTLGRVPAKVYVQNVLSYQHAVWDLRNDVDRRWLADRNSPNRSAARPLMPAWCRACSCIFRVATRWEHTTPARCDGSRRHATDLQIHKYRARLFLDMSKPFQMLYASKNAAETDQRGLGSASRTRANDSANAGHRLIASPRA
jgi:hypothetical protein